MMVYSECTTGTNGITTEEGRGTVDNRSYFNHVNIMDTKSKEKGVENGHCSDMEAKILHNSLIC